MERSANQSGAAFRRRNPIERTGLLALRLKKRRSKLNEEFNRFVKSAPGQRESDRWKGRKGKGRGMEKDFRI